MIFKNFLADESGAITVDWVVLTASVAALGLAAVLGLSGGAVNLGGDISTELQKDEVFVNGMPSQGQAPAEAVPES